VIGHLLLLDNHLNMLATLKKLLIVAKLKSAVGFQVKKSVIEADDSKPGPNIIKPFTTVIYEFS
jgi:hypothetical protein